MEFLIKIGLGKEGGRGSGQGKGFIIIIFIYGCGMREFEKENFF